MPVLDDILEWSTSRPDWQRDALRRIITQGALTESDIQDLTRLCLSGHGVRMGDESQQEGEPLAAEHIPTDGEDAGCVELVQLRDVLGVNALASGQEVSFQPGGMTIVFGYNGAGKSGYARVLRRLCHVRGAEAAILPNAFEDSGEQVPAATVDYRVADDERSVAWQEGQASPAELGRVSFFDSDCAAVHVAGTNELAFTPFGLDVLPKLEAVCRRVKDRVQAIVQQVQQTGRPSMSAPQAAEGTHVRRELDGLTADSDISAFRRLAEITGGDRSRAAELAEELGADPAARAREHRNSASRLGQLRQALVSTSDVLSSEAVERVRSAVETLTQRRAAAQAAADRAFSDLPLTGVGEEVWKSLWEAAREYSRQRAYPGRDFPVTDEDARCVLCQQPLESDARHRLRSLETFVQDTTQRQAETARQALTDAIQPVMQLVTGHAAYAERLPDVPDDGGGGRSLRRDIRRYLRLAWKVRSSLVRSAESEDWKTPSVVPESPVGRIDDLITHHEQRATSLQAAATGVRRVELLAEQAELQARMWLAGVLEDVEAEIQRLERLAALAAAQSDTATTGVTRKSGELTDRASPRHAGEPERPEPS